MLIEHRATYLSCFRKRHGRPCRRNTDQQVPNDNRYSPPPLTALPTPSVSVSPLLQSAHIDTNPFFSLKLVIPKHKIQTPSKSLCLCLRRQHCQVLQTMRKEASRLHRRPLALGWFVTEMAKTETGAHGIPSLEF